MGGGCAGMMQSMNGGDGRPNSQWRHNSARERDAGLTACCRSAPFRTGLLLLLALALPAGAARAAASGWASNAHGAARLITAVEATGSSAQLDVGLQLRLSPGWHTYWRNPGDAGIAPSIDWRGSDNLARATIAWPAPRRLPPLAGLQTYGYVGGVVLPIAIRLAHPGAALRLHAEVDYAACKEICIPYHASLDLALPAGLALPGPQAPLIAAALARVPGGLAAGRLRLLGAVVAPGKTGAVLGVRLESLGMALRAPDLFVEGVGDGSPGQPEVTLAEGGRIATLRVPIRGTTAAKLAGRRLHLTLVDGDPSAETDVDAAGRRPAAAARAGRHPARDRRHRPTRWPDAEPDALRAAGVVAKTAGAGRLCGRRAPRRTRSACSRRRRGSSFPSPCSRRC